MYYDRITWIWYNYYSEFDNKQQKSEKKYETIEKPKKHHETLSEMLKLT